MGDILLHLPCVSVNGVGRVAPRGEMIYGGQNLIRVLRADIPRKRLAPYESRRRYGPSAKHRNWGKGLLLLRSGIEYLNFSFHIGT